MSNFIIKRIHIWKPYLENFNHFIVLDFYVIRIGPYFHKSLIVIDFFLFEFIFTKAKVSEVSKWAFINMDFIVFDTCTLLWFNQY
jgi:hypothetical protein